MRLSVFHYEPNQTALNDFYPFCPSFPFVGAHPHLAHRGPEFALQQIEGQNSISLSRSLGTPNISSKGALEPRVASIPAKWFPSSHHHRPSLDKSPNKKLIEIVSSAAAVSGVDGPPGLVQPKGAISPHNNHVETPIWIWSQEGGEIHITVQVPKLVRTL